MESLRGRASQGHIKILAKVFGGSKVFKQMSNVGDKNIKFAQNYLVMESITLLDADIGSVYPRKGIFKSFSGRPFVKNWIVCITTPEVAVKVIMVTTYKAEHSNIEGDIELF